MQINQLFYSFQQQHENKNRNLFTETGNLLPLYFSWRLLKHTVERPREATGSAIP